MDLNLDILEGHFFCGDEFKSGFLTRNNIRGNA